MSNKTNQVWTKLLTLTVRKEERGQFFELLPTFQWDTFDDVPPVAETTAFRSFLQDGTGKSLTDARDRRELVEFRTVDRYRVGRNCIDPNNHTRTQSQVFRQSPMKHAPTNGFITRAARGDIPNANLARDANTEP